MQKISRSVENVKNFIIIIIIIIIIIVIIIFFINSFRM